MATSVLDALETQGWSKQPLLIHVMSEGGMRIFLKTAHMSFKEQSVRFRTPWCSYNPDSQLSHTSASAEKVFPRQHFGFRVWLVPKPFWICFNIKCLFSRHGTTREVGRTPSMGHHLHRAFVISLASRINMYFSDRNPSKRSSTWSAWFRARCRWCPPWECQLWMNTEKSWWHNTYVFSHEKRNVHTGSLQKWIHFWSVAVRRQATALLDWNERLYLQS